MIITYSVTGLFGQWFFTDTHVESIIIPLLKNGTPKDYSTPRRISLIPTVAKVLASIMLRHLTLIGRNKIREQQVGFRPSRCCVDQSFTPRLLRETRHICIYPTIEFFLHLEGPLDLIHLTMLSSALHRKNLPMKSIRSL